MHIIFMVFGFFVVCGWVKSIFTAKNPSPYDPPEPRYDLVDPPQTTPEGTRRHEPHL